LFKLLSGTDIVHVPYKGGGLSLQAVFAGETQLTFDTLGTSLALIRDGKLRAIAIGAQKRSAELPDVPTMVEAGFPQLTTGAWTAILAPRGTPETIVARVNAATNKTLTSEPMKGTLAKLGAQPRGGTPKELADYIASETAKWKPIVEKLGLYKAK
jgi:tripartite-type tricarboxylate transporter receptor subunit TctC